MSFLKSFWKGNTKHKKLYDEAALASNIYDLQPVQESVKEVTFQVKYLGSTLVEKPSSKEATAEAVKTVISMAKASGKKAQRVSLSVNLNGIKMVDVPTEETHLEVSIYRISYCSADAAHGQVFAFIATNANETMECHAFLCPKRKTAQIMSLTLARVFRMAYDLWTETLTDNRYILPENKKDVDFQNNHIFDNNFNSNEVDSKALLIDFNAEISDSEGDTKALLIDFNIEDTEGNRLGNWKSFDEDAGDNLNYTRLWDDEKRKPFTVSAASHFQHFLKSSNLNGNHWEDSRANLLCS